MRLLAVLGGGERSVSALQEILRLESSGASQHLAALRRQGLVDSRRDGTTVFYRVKNPRTAPLLELARQILTSSLNESSGLLRRLDDPPGRARSPEPNGPAPES